MISPLRLVASQYVTPVILRHIARKHGVIMITDGESFRAAWNFHRRLHKRGRAYRARRPH